MSLLVRGVFAIRRRLGLFDRLEEKWKKFLCTVGEDVHLHKSSRIKNDGLGRDAIRIGAHTHVHGVIQLMEHGGSVGIGEYCYIGEDARIWSCESIVIGDRVLISHGVNIHDNIAHSLSAEQRHRHIRQIYGIDSSSGSADVAAAPVVIEDDVWIGFNSTVLKGVTIGKGGVIGAATVVTKDVEPYAIMVGNPARQIGWARR